MELDGIVRGDDEVVRGIMDPSTLIEHPSCNYYPILSQIIASRWMLFEA